MVFFLEELRRTSRSLAREPGFIVPAAIALTLGVGLLLSTVGLLQVESVRPLQLGSTLRPEYIRAAGWGASWHGPHWSASQLQAAHFASFLEVLAVVAALGFAAACFTVVILVLIRASTRTPELALRAAVGASRRRMLERLLAEGTVLAAVGAVFGLGLGFVGLNVARASWPHELASAGVGISPWLVLLALAAPAATAVPFSLAAAAGVLRRSDLSGALVSGAGGMAGRGELILQDFLAIVQLAISVALVVGAGLLVRSGMPTGSAASFGSDPREILMVQLDLPETARASATERASFYEALLGEVQGQAAHEGALATPGVWLGVGSMVFVTAQCGRCYLSGVYVPLMPGYVRLHAVSPGFFRTLGVRLIQGREFSAADGLDARRVMLVNRAFAGSHFENGEPVGRMVQIGGIQDPWYTVVGVVDDISGRGVGPAVRAAPVAYVPILQEPPLAADLAVLGVGEEAGELAAAATRAAARTSVPALISDASTLAAYLARQAAPVRWLGAALGVVGGLVLIIGLYGTYTVMRFKVSRQVREIGLRRALGAKPRRIVRVVVLQSLGLTAIGAGLGVFGTLLVAGWLDMIVPGLRAFDVWTYGGALVFLSLAALAGGSIPARQAARIDPAVAMRTE